MLLLTELNDGISFHARLQSCSDRYDVEKQLFNLSCASTLDCKCMLMTGQGILRRG